MYRCYAVNNDVFNAELSAKVDAMSGHVQQVLDLLQSEHSGLRASSSTGGKRDVGNLQVTLRSTATLVTTAASIIETRSSQWGSRGAPSISGLPLTKDQRISIAEWIPEPISEEEAPMDGISNTELSASRIQGDSEYEYAGHYLNSNCVTIVWDIKSQGTKSGRGVVGRIEWDTSVKPLCMYLYRDVGVNAHQHVATIRHTAGWSCIKWNLILPDSRREIDMVWGRVEYNGVRYRWHKDMKLQAANGKIVGSLEWDRSHPVRRALTKLTLWDGVSNMANVALITCVAAYMTHFGPTKA